ncbi:MAG: hypothetical protein ACR2PK_04580 [Acidimicrobiales bacterium]
MYEPDLDPFTADAILDGDPAPSTPVELAGLIAALKSPPTESELVGGEDVFVRAIGAHGLSTVSAGTSVVRRLTKKTVALGAAGAVLFGGVAAATGALPVLDTVIPGGDVPTLVSVTDDEADEEGDNEEHEVENDAGEFEGVESLTESTKVPDEEGSAEDRGDRVSEAAQSDCGKPDKDGGSDDGGGDDGSTDGAADDGSDDGADDDVYAELCESARNHGEYVSTVARDKDGDGIPDVGKEHAPGQLKKAAGADDGGEEDGLSDGESTTEAESSSSGTSKGNGKAKHKNKD